MSVVEEIIAETNMTSVCGQGNVRCNSTNLLGHCHHGGLCCLRELIFPFCRCKAGYTGEKCEEEYFHQAMSLNKQSMMMIGTSSIISLTVAVLALVVLAVVIVLFVRRTQQRNAWKESAQRRMEDLSQDIHQVQKEIGKLPNADKLSRLNRLTRLVEVSCLTGTALVFTNKAPALPPPSHAYLPRWSSAPGHLHEAGAVDDVDGDVMTKEKKMKLKQLFSFQGVPAAAAAASHNVHI